jgi:toxin ParE1/3/4
MAAYRLSRKAAIDIGGIYEYTTANFGLTQARRYLNGMHERFGDLARQPMLGRAAGRLAPNLRRYEYRSHVVFYVPDQEGVLIVRVLHQSMDIRRHVMDDEEDA